ncbi:Fucolectin-1 [Anabarilius grahami]|uniref:Mediator of RNA polymerase II transcription subunit 30 n=1 Tax=Anabarilius grahami TaxID=495550 RepID=A0A3N0YZH0_ANAGA|nr:Fucolectin-1 [Anabarilius grahami]
MEHHQRDESFTHGDLTCSANQTFYLKGVAQHAVDGNRDSTHGKGSCTHTNAEFNPWWRVDLGNVYSVSNITITNRGDCCKERLKGAQIRIGNSLANNGNNNALVATVLTVLGATETFSFEPVNGRYVNIYLPGNNEILTLCEVEVFAGNLALGATAVQSTTYPQSGAQNAVDGNRNPIFSRQSCSATNADRNPWWRVDLLEVYKITRVSITNRGDCCAERINGAQIRIGNSLENNGNNNQLAATVVSIPLGETQTLEFKPIRGRYVNIFITGRNEYLTLCELEKVRQKNQEIKVLMDQMRNLLWDINVMLTMQNDSGMLPNIWPSSVNPQSSQCIFSHEYQQTAFRSLLIHLK